MHHSYLFIILNQKCWKKRFIMSKTQSLRRLTANATATTIVFASILESAARQQERLVKYFP